MSKLVPERLVVHRARVLDRGLDVRPAPLERLAPGLLVVPADELEDRRRVGFGERLLGLVQGGDQSPDEVLVSLMTWSLAISSLL